MSSPDSEASPPIASPYGDSHTSHEKPAPSRAKQIFKARQLSVCSIALSFLLPLLLIGGATILASQPWNPLNANLFPILQWSLSSALYLFQIYAAWRLIQALETPFKWLLLVLSLLPCIGILGLMILNAVATEELRNHGINLGFTKTSGNFEDY